jgi:hypothetical protein
MADTDRPNAFGVMFYMFLFYFIMLIAVYIAKQFVAPIPATTIGGVPVVNPVYAFLNGAITVFDDSFIFIFIIGVFLDPISAWVDPDPVRGIVNILALLFLTFFSLIIAVNLASLSFLNPATLLPQSTAFFSNYYYLIITFITLALSIVFNFRKKQEQPIMYEGHGFGNPY